MRDRQGEAHQLKAEALTFSLWLAFDGISQKDVR